MIIYHILVYGSHSIYETESSFPKELSSKNLGYQFPLFES